MNEAVRWGAGSEEEGRGKERKGRDGRNGYGDGTAWRLRTSHASVVLLLFLSGSRGMAG